MSARRNISKKRAAIYAALASTTEHPTAEMLHDRLRPDYPELSLATVYRNLRLLEENGSIISLGEINGQERFDANVGPHGHFICRNCGRVSDFSYSGDGLADRVKALACAGFEVSGVEIRMNGLCAECSGHCVGN